MLNKISKYVIGFLFVFNTNVLAAEKEVDYNKLLSGISSALDQKEKSSSVEWKEKEKRLQLEAQALKAMNALKEGYLRRIPDLEKVLNTTQDILRKKLTYKIYWDSYSVVDGKYQGYVKFINVVQAATALSPINKRYNDINMLLKIYLPNLADYNTREMATIIKQAEILSIPLIKNIEEESDTKTANTAEVVQELIHIEPNKIILGMTVYETSNNYIIVKLDNEYK